ncbi:MAG: hypothetical protein GTO60_07995, partial [Gammaproteobacteria bacterium]|nr:hypothetical protein [Gammaproteobacteria bacterium]
MLIRSLTLVSFLFLALSLKVFAQSDLLLLEAAKSRNMDAVTLHLSNSGVDVNEAKADGTTALHWAVHWGELDMVDLLLAAGADPDPSNDYGVTPPLMQACINKNNGMVIKLLDAGADPNALMVTGVSALMKCSQTGAVEGVRALIKAGADVNISESRNGQTALMWAISSAQAPIVNALLEAGADISSRTVGGFTPLL